MLARGEKKREIANSASLLLAVTCEYQETKRPRFLHQVQSKKIGESLENYTKEEQQSLGKKGKNQSERVDLVLWGIMVVGAASHRAHLARAWGPSSSDPSTWSGGELLLFLSTLPARSSSGLPQVMVVVLSSSGPSAPNLRMARQLRGL